MTRRPTPGAGHGRAGAACRRGAGPTSTKSAAPSSTWSETAGFIDYAQARDYARDVGRAAEAIDALIDGGSAEDAIYLARDALDWVTEAVRFCGRFFGPHRHRGVRAVGRPPARLPGGTARSARSWRVPGRRQPRRQLRPRARPAGLHGPARRRGHRRLPRTRCRRLRGETGTVERQEPDGIPAQDRRGTSTLSSPSTQHTSTTAASSTCGLPRCSTRQAVTTTPSTGPNAASAQPPALTTGSSTTW